MRISRFLSDEYSTLVAYIGFFRGPIYFIDFQSILVKRSAVRK